MSLVFTSPEQKETDFHWFVVVSKRHQEKLVAGTISNAKKKNILEVFCPVNTTVTVRRMGKDVKVPLYAGHVFVYSTYNALLDLLKAKLPEVSILCRTIVSEVNNNERIQQPIVVPELQMKAFKDFNDSYSDQVVFVDKKFLDYEANKKTGKSNEIVKILDGAFAGRKGFVARFKGEKRLVFNIIDDDDLPSLTVSLPNLWSFRMARLLNGDIKRVGDSMQRAIAIDLLMGSIEACCMDAKQKPAEILNDCLIYLCNNHSFKQLRQLIENMGGQSLKLSKAFSEYSDEEVDMINTLVRYESENPGYVKYTWLRNIIRPFLTPTSGVDMQGMDRQQLQHHSFTEIIRKREVTENVYYPRSNEERNVTSTYYAHIGKYQKKDGTIILFTNWDQFLEKYYQTIGEAKKNLVEGEKLIESFRNYAPTLYHILTDKDSPIKAKKNLLIKSHKLNVLYMEVSNEADVDKAEDTLTNTCLQLCLEINGSAHLAVWRRYLECVWLHR